MADQNAIRAQGGHGIAWCDATVNWWWGCSKASPACANCYAEIQADRFRSGNWGPSAPRLLRVDAARKEAMRYQRRAAKEGTRMRIFTLSMGDFFEDREDLDAPRLAALEVMRTTPNLDWLILTKRPERIKPILMRVATLATKQLQTDTALWLQSWFLGKNPPGNVWLGATVEDQETADRRIPALLTTPAVLRFLSCEPLLGQVDISGWIGASSPHGPNDERHPGLQIRDGRMAGNSPGRVHLENRTAQKEQVGRCGHNSPSHATSDRYQDEVGVSIGQGNGGRRTDIRVGPSPDMDPFQRPHSADDDHQPQKRSQVGQSPRESGVGHILRASGSCPSDSQSREDRSTRREKLHVKIDGSGRQRDPGTEETGRKADPYCAGFRSELPDCLEDCPGKALGISWVICGGESGPKARPMHPNWARSLRDQCADAGVPFLFKQWGEWIPTERTPEVHARATMPGQCGDVWAWPDGTQDGWRTGPVSVRVGKKAAGRTLDGEIINEFPIHIL